MKPCDVVKAAAAAKLVEIRKILEITQAKEFVAEIRGAWGSAAIIAGPAPDGGSRRWIASVHHGHYKNGRKITGSIVVSI